MAQNTSSSGIPRKKEWSPTEMSNKSVPSPPCLSGYKSMSHISLHTRRDICCQHNTGYLPQQRVPLYSNCLKDHARSEKHNGKGSRAKTTGL